MNISHVQVLSVPVADQERAKAFYIDTLGFDLIRDNPMGPDARWIQVAPKGAETGVTLVTWFESMPAGSLSGLVLQSQDVDADCERLRRAGVTVEGPEDAFWGRHATFSDPDGNRLVLAAPPPTPSA